jgi:hypothetical protein
VEVVYVLGTMDIFQRNHLISVRKYKYLAERNGVKPMKSRTKRRFVYEQPNGEREIGNIVMRICVNGGVLIKDVEIKYKNQSFTVGLIQDEKLFQQNVRGAHYAPVYDSRAFDYLAYRVVRRGRSRFDNRIVIAGPPRTGKSTIACTWAKHVDPDFSVDSVAFRLEDYKKILHELPPADPENEKWPMAILDESGVDLYAKDWATRMVKDMVKVFQIVGKKRLTMMMCLPHRNLLTKDMRDEMHWWCNTSVEDDELRGFCEIRYAKPNPWAAPYWNPLFGIVYEELTGKWWGEYEKKKDDFIDDYTKQESATVPHRIQQLTDQRNALIIELRKDHSLRDIEKMTGLDHGNISRIALQSRTTGSPLPARKY